MLSCSLAIFATVMASEVPAAPPSPTSQDVRSAVEQSLPYVEKIAAAWMRERKCNSCHNVTFLVWTHNEAAARGFNIDRTKLAEWTKWSLADSLSDRFWFKLRPRSMASLRADGLSEALLGKLKPLEEKTYLTHQDYLHALEEAMGSENLAVNKERLLKEATLPNNGGGPDTLSQLLLGRAVSSEDTSKDKGENESYAAIRSLLLEWQEPDGSWQAQGQLPGLKWAGTNEMHQATTMWSLLAVSAGNPKEETLVREFLLRTQDKDGSWQVQQEAINTRRRGLNVFTFWGTAWATIGLLQTLPAADHSP